jgi:hypothetical protein
VAEKRKISYEQSLALDRGRQTAHANQRRAVDARQAAEKAQAERERRDAEQAAELKRRRNGFEPGDRVTGRDYFWNEHRTGTVTDAPPQQEGVPVLCDDGETRLLHFHSVKALDTDSESS